MNKPRRKSAFSTASEAMKIDEEFVVDQEGGSWCVFGVDTDFCYFVTKDKATAQEKADAMNAKKGVQLPKAADTSKFYYVSVKDAGRSSRAMGPFRTHQEALDRVQEAMDLAYDLDPKSHFYSWGTMSTDKDMGPGALDVALKQGKVVTAADDIGTSRQPAIRPIFNKVAPLLVKPFQTAMKKTTTQQRKKLIQTYLGKVDLKGKAPTAKTHKMMRDILVEALKKDRGWLEFVAEQMLDGSTKELTELLATPKEASMKTSKSSLLQHISTGATPTMKDLGALNLDFPFSIDVSEMSKYNNILSDTASKLGLAVDNGTVEVENNGDILDLFDLLLDTEEVLAGEADSNATGNPPPKGTYAALIHLAKKLGIK